jgi:biopolymer transport protein ExbB
VEDLGGGLGDFIRAGGFVGHVILLVSVAGIALAIDGLLRIRSGRLVPPLVTEQLVGLAQAGKYDDMFILCRNIDCLLTRIVYEALAQGKVSLSDAREIMQGQGTREVTRLHQRVGILGFLAAAAPMLGLLGTVLGMMKAFNVLGAAGAAAPPEQLAAGVGQALATMAEGLLVALPLMFFHGFLRDRVTRVGQDAAEVCDRLIRALEEGAVPESPPPPPAAEADESLSLGEP